MCQSPAVLRIRSNRLPMDTKFSEMIRRHSRPLAPLATDVAPHHAVLPGIRCVLFDVYGTLLISGSGEVGTLLPEAAETAFVESVTLLGIETEITESEGREALTAAIEASHTESRGRGVEYPEVDIVAIWQSALASLAETGRLHLPEAIDYQRLALEYELRTNPTWPMPGAAECLGQLRAAGLSLGLISNAQFFTPMLLETLLPTAFGDEIARDDRNYFSYQQGEAKPGSSLFELARGDLEQDGIAPHEVLYVGNDMLNDVLPAAAVGFQTALFAGDRRSLRMREGDSRMTALRPGAPDLVLVELESLPTCMEAARRELE
ncbi:MAG: HAD family hydrolase [Planctomycetota bacterium]|mgnify:CR=1 FL=1|nr:MAG: HAD family hydrolase [Planctomycetota bacterium]REK23012.1 MAG: HAD family hydrolase [Planctomycetota bacterium]REK43375.1 MAG: HAD family hydrolase [Planctomycetota bacterium]